ncbi:MAG TPA: MauE/DoxX family redox-associated membrane protein [Verrucomicrobiae bacterium]|nr:MauE/DoxX family redox-associated membrane protein [Verrucomicrobiae bacterium]
MRVLGQILLWLTDHGYQLLLVGVVVVLLVRNPQSRRKVVRALLVLGGIIVGSVFLAAAYGKMKPPDGFPWSWASMRISLAWFAMQVDSYKLLAPSLVNAVAHFLPYFELFLGVWLITCIWQRFSAPIAALAICGFMIAITTAYFRGLKIDCGCGIGPPEEVGPAALLRDGLKFLLPAVLVTIGRYWLRRRSRADAALSAAPLISSTQATN